MNLKQVISSIIKRYWPELNSGTHLPRLAVVIGIPDPPKNGEKHTDERPRYAVDVRLLLPDLSIDEDMPLIRDVPVAFPAAAPERGFVGLPQPGTIVEIAFAFGRQTLPFVRSVLPHYLKLPKIDELAMRWQQSADSFQEVDRNGSWSRITNRDIRDQADHYNTTARKIVLKSSTTAIEQSELAMRGNQLWIGGPATRATGKVTFSRLNTAVPLMIPLGTIIADAADNVRVLTTADANMAAGSEKIEVPVEAECYGAAYNQDEDCYCRLISANVGINAVRNEDKIQGGTNGVNALVLDVSFMTAVINALTTLASHTHPDVGTISQGAAVTEQKTIIEGLKLQLNAFTKT